MSFQEKRSIVSLVGTLLVSALYGVYVFQRYQEGNWVSENVFKFWGSVILLYVPVSIVLKVFIHVVFIVINMVATREEEPSFTDEMDRLIELRAVRNFCYVFMAGFFLSMGVLVIDLSPSVMFLGLLLTAAVSGAVMDISEIYFYRRGF